MTLDQINLCDSTDERMRVVVLSGTHSAVNLTQIRAYIARHEGLVVVEVPEGVTVTQTITVTPNITAATEYLIGGLQSRPRVQPNDWYQQHNTRNYQKRGKK